jgi:hypothetical protein
MWLITRWAAVAALLCAACGGRPAAPYDDFDGSTAGDGPAAEAGQHDGGGDAQRDAGPQLDAAGWAGILCGWGICAIGEEMCCVTGSAPDQECVAVDVTRPRCDFAARCDGPEDCGNGQQCCMPSGAIIQSYCVAGACPAGRALCHPGDTCARSGETCCLSLEFGWEHWVCLPGSQCPS